MMGMLVALRRIFTRKQANRDSTSKEESRKEWVSIWKTKLPINLTEKNEHRVRYECDRR